jgi:hypothetical protein
MMQNSYVGQTSDTRILVTSTHFLQRARQYRYAAALTDDRQNIQKLIDLAFMFERLADDFKRLEATKSRAFSADCRNEHASSVAGMARRGSLPHRQEV